MNQIVIYPGSFDPLTFGHLDIIERAAQRFEKIIIAVGVNDLKQALIPEAERLELIKKVVAPFANVDVQRFSGLLVDFAKQTGANLILRGIRNGTDCDFEQQLAHMNRSLSPALDTVFMMPSATVQAIASTLVRTIVRAGGDVSAFVPKVVAEALAKART